MNKEQEYGLSFKIDKLTNSIENVKSGDRFPTEISLLTQEEAEVSSEKEGWKFNWKVEMKIPNREVYKLTITNNPNIIQGIVSLEMKTDHVYMHLIESAPFNIGKNKAYLGVPGNLVAFACRLSFQRGCDGFLSFLSKTKLIEHYQKSLGAQHVGNRIMVINTKAALQLTNKYFKE